MLSYTASGIFILLHCFCIAIHSIKRRVRRIQRFLRALLPTHPQWFFFHKRSCSALFAADMPCALSHRIVKCIFNGFASPWILTAISLGLLILSHIAAHFRIVYLSVLRNHLCALLIRFNTSVLHGTDFLSPITSAFIFRCKKPFLNYSFALVNCRTIITVLLWKTFRFFSQLSFSRIYCISYKYTFWIALVFSVESICNITYILVRFLWHHYKNSVFSHIFQFILVKCNGMKYNDFNLLWSTVYGHIFEGNTGHEPVTTLRGENTLWKSLFLVVRFYRVLVL